MSFAVAVGGNYGRQPGQWLDYSTLCAMPVSLDFIPQILF